MGLTASSSNGSKPASVLPILGHGEYQNVGCADIMIASESENDLGLFARIFYPASARSDVHDDAVVYPIWKPRKEYLDGLAEYRQMSKHKLHFFFDWIIGERRVPAGWHEPLYSLKHERERMHNTSLHGSKSSGQLNHEANGTVPHLTTSQSESCLDEHEKKFPVLVFSHGISGNRLCYSTLCASLASYGFVVFALEHRDRSSCWTFSLETDALSGIVVEKPILMTTYPDGEGEFKRCNKQLHKRIAEMVRALNVLEELNLGTCAPADKRPKGSKIIYGHNFDWSQFKDRLDIEKAAVIGHSFGASSAIGSCCFSTDFVTCVSLDGWLFPIETDLYARFIQPALFINAKKWQWVENIKRMLRLENCLEQNIFTFNDIVHQSFSDFSYLMPGYVGRKFALQGELDPIHTGEAVLEMVVTHLRNSFEKQPLLDHLREVAKRYEHFVVEGTNLDEMEADKEEQNSSASSPTTEEPKTEAPTNVEFEPPAETANN
ncbi:1-alkyl-2-acetylglycerophosphocholine esterase [Aphelenchoides bicaudatus]|nr:1-alkyl-2-acetylglycerophosphocholine esterase [Aphelenchoides bicaudatus]